MRIKILIMFIAIGLISACGGTGENTDGAAMEFKGTGRIITIDKGRAVMTVQHEEIKGLMSAMTMDFPVAEKKLIEGVDSGIYIDFTLKKVGEDMQIVEFKEIPAPTIDGAKIYEESCVKCHGEKGEGRKKGIPLIEGHALSHTEDEFLKQVRGGGEKMPAFSDKLSEKEIAAVVKYVREEVQKGLRKDEAPNHEH